MFDGMSKEEFKKMLEAQAANSDEATPMNADALFDLFTQHGDDTFILARRKKLIDLLKERHGDGVLLVWGGFEGDGKEFEQESALYHLTGVQEPGVLLALDTSDGKATLFVPQQEIDRSQWVNGKVLEPTQESAHTALVDEIIYQGDAQKGYASSPLAPIDCYKNVLTFIRGLVENNRTIFLSTPGVYTGNVIPVYMNMLFEKYIPGFLESVVDATEQLAFVRHEKDPSELEKICEAIDITRCALQTVVSALATNQFENEIQIQVALEAQMKLLGGTLAFPSIVASGNNATVLHYIDNNVDLKKDDLLLIDCGARYKGYCADISRTVPISGTFSERQKELYQIVLNTQSYIAGIARPGYWLNNKNEQEQSLHHLAIAYLQEQGYADYFIHGIGHHLGIDVHDTCVVSIPLQEGDVFTIEPGLYLKDEGIGIRIEDNYIMTKNGTECLSASIPKEVDDVEKWAQGKLDFDAFLKNIS